MSVTTTQGIRISVEARYLPEDSEPDKQRYLFAYEITIENEGTQPAQLVSRHWIIKDAFSSIEEVRGEGVVGQTPYLEAGESFTYSSYCPLRTDYGTMRGSYRMMRPDGEEFDATIAPFALMATYLLN
ncbi:MAG TPA: Co2+/Mg2+ efflux protein ApaG [Abditibacteriaceae bacterium]|jgi:ApaG protein